MRTNAKWFLLAGCLAAVLGGEARGETREFDPYAGDFNLTNGEIVYPPADRLARVRLRDWMGKDLGSVTGVVLGTSFSIDAKNYFNGTVDYVTAFDGGTVAKASSDTYASGSKVTWKDIGGGLETEIFIQPRVPYPAEPRYGMADPWIVKDPKKNTWYSLITSGTSLKYRPNTSFPTADWGVTGGKGETTFFRFAEHPDEFGEYLQNCWAPEMHYIRGSWYIYTCLTRTSADNTQRIHCLKLDGDDITSSSGWHLAKRFVTPGTKDSDSIAWAIDATVLDDTDASGRMWLIWSGWPSVNNQNLYMAELATPTSFVANASRVLLSKPTESWELLNRKVNEGPVVLRHGNATHVVYSCNGCASDDYSLALLTCTNGDYGVASSWKKHDGRIFVTRKTAYGPGHCSFTKDAAGNEYVVYHAKYESGHTDYSYYSYRDMRFQPIAWHGDFPVLGAPRPFEGSTDSFNANADYTKTDADRRTVVHCPSTLIEAVEYTGGEQSPSWARYASVTVVSGGTRTEPGTNTVTLALADTTRYVWSDGTTANKTAKFAILPSAQAHEHAWGEWETAVSPGCETDGYEVRVCTASGCTVPAAAETNAIAALDHDWGAWVTDVQPKIGVAGHRYRDCSRCDAYAEETIPPLSTEVMTNAMANAAWGYEIRGLGDDYLDVALVFTNATETTMTWTVPDGVTSFDFLVVGGGGSGGGNKSYYGAGGGGAGGVVTGYLAQVTGGDLFAVSVGAGGQQTATGSNAGNKGKDSALASGDRQIVAYGGGGGGKNAATGSEGGSGGGSGTNGGNGGSATAGSVTGFGLEQRVANENGYFDAFGFKGGSCTANYAGAGGGGAGGVGGDGTSSTAAGKGGDGILCNLTGKNVRYAGGGGGGASYNNGKIGAGGAGGGGSGGGRTSNAAKPGTDGRGGGGGGGGGASDTSVYSVGAAGGSGVVVIRYTSAGEQPTGKWDAIESSQVDGVTDANKVAVETTLDAIQAALQEGATAAKVGEWLTTVYGNQKVSAATLANAKQVGISVKYDLPLLVSETPTVTVEASSDPMSETGVAAFVFTIMDGETPVPVTNAKVQEMVQYAATLAGGFAPSTSAEVEVTPDGTAIRAELQRVEGRSSGFMKIKLSEAEE